MNNGNGNSTNRSSESLPLLQRRPSSFSSITRKTSFGNSIRQAELNARQVLSRPTAVIGEADSAAHQRIVRKAKIRNVIFPFDLSYKIWWSITAVGAIGTAFLLPYEIAFQEEKAKMEDVGAIIEVGLEVIFCLDILINFNLAIYKDSRLTFERSEIIRNYLRCMFWVDLSGVFPFQFVALLLTGNFGRNVVGDVLLYSLWRLPRLVRLRRLKKLSDIMQFDGHISFLWFTLIRNFAAVLLVAHWEACTMYFLARLKDLSEDTWLGPLVAEGGEAQTTFDLYLTSLYLSVVTFCTVGYGDFSPHNAVEKLLGTIFMLLNIVVAAWIIGSITLLIVKGDEKTGAYRDNLDCLQQYGHMHEFDDTFMNGLKSQLKLGFQNQEISDEQVLKPFPSPVRRKILRKLYLKPLLQTQLMKGVRQQFVDAFLASCKVEIFSPGEEVVERGSILSDLFLLVGGIAESADNYLRPVDIEDGSGFDSERVTFETGDFIGEIGFFTESPQVESVTCLTVCKTLTISRSDYKLLENDHPGSVGKILQNLLAKVEELSLKIDLPEKLTVLRAGSVFQNPVDETEMLDTSYDFGETSRSEKESRDVARKETLTAVKDLIEMHMSKQLDDQTTRLLFAASRGDSATIALMCDQGFNPNNSDYDHRTALMVASMKGNTEVVKMLLDYKADPNLVDMHSSTALLEAVKNGHGDTMELLQKRGAKLCMKESFAASTLCQAVFDGDSALLRRLLEAGTPVNACDYDKRTAAHIAAAEANLSAFQALCAHGADLQLEDRWGSTPMMEAERHGSKKILDFIRAL
ncbi:ankyrin repeat domain protein [Nitzschia inconspicua]|uniref:Ankyrin repeat domain protein n=1 Tax=Nitzschia inconspicua TaxID=303405 RepID=A0A9K3PLI5_9STRA|nr:ankyrin repeat domain protein [Nitzschia inconspicua]